MNDTAKLQDLYNRLHFFPSTETPSLDTFLQSQQQPLPVSIRYNPHKSLVPINDHIVPWEPRAIYLPERPIFTLDPALHAGAYYVQEASSMCTGYIFDYLHQGNFDNIKVLDLCAAPGGKSTHLASFLPNTSLLISNEVIQSRAAILSENISKWGQMNTWVTNLDPHHFEKISGFFDTIVVDAPCTGSGLWRRDADAMDEWSENNVQLCSERQKRIVADAFKSLKTNGYLIYSTCSFSKEENEDIVDWICKELEMESITIPFPNEWNIITSESADQNSAYRLVPWKLKGEGFFIAAFKKKTAVETATLQKKKNNQPSFSYTNKQTQSIVANWLNIPIVCIEKNEELYAIPLDLKEHFELLQQQNIKLKKTGTALGKIIKNQLIPHEEMAFSIHLQNQYGQVEVDKETAIQYLRKEEIKSEQALQGWQLIQYQGLGLGWSKWMSNRMNNYYPKNWRIRMGGN